MVKHVNAAFNDDTHEELDEQKGGRSWPDAIEEWAAAEREAEELREEVAELRTEVNEA